MNRRLTSPLADARGYVLSPHTRLSLLRLIPLLALLLAVSISGCGGDSSSPDGSGSNDPGAEDSGGGLSAFFGRSDDSEESSEEKGSSSAGGVRKTGDTITNSIGMKLAVVPPGEFMMGSPDTEEKRSGDEVQHRVKLTKPIFMGAYEVTQAEFQQVMESNPSGITDSDTLPVHNVSWEQATAFCRKLSDLPEEKAAGRVYRLPTEAEWEYACRSGSRTPSSFGAMLTSASANFDGNYPYGTETTGTFVGKPQAVGSYEANAWGLYDMHGNVWEWCHDWFSADYYRSSAADDPQGPDNGISHVIRGGSWYNFGYALRSAYRSEFTPPLEANIYGFRVVASFGKADTFEASALDNPDPTPMTTPPPSTPTPEPATVASTTPPGSSPAMAMADATAMASTMGSGMSGEESMSRSGSSSPKSSGRTEMETPPNEETAKAKPGSRRAASSGVTGRQVLLLPFALLALLSLMDAGRVLQSRHLDLLPFAVMAIAAVIPDTTARTAILWAAAIGTAARLLYGLKKNSLPKPVVPKLSEAVLLILLIAVFAVVAFLHLATGTGGSFVATILAISTSAAIAVALVLIGQRWKDRTLGYTVAIFWLVLPASPPPVAAAVILWSLVFLNRAPLAGTLAGLAIALSGWLCCVLPLWASFYRGKARSRYLTTAAVFGVGGQLARCLLPESLAGTGLTSAALGTTTMIVTLAVLGAASAAARFWPKDKSEATVVAVSAVLLATLFICTRSGAVAAQTLPWLALVLVGGCASRGRALVTEGALIPAIRKWRAAAASPDAQS